MSSEMLKMIIVAMPLFIFVVNAAFEIKDAVMQKKYMSRVIKNTTRTMDDIETAAIEEDYSSKKESFFKKFIRKQNAKLKLLGFNYNYETVILAGVIAGLLGAFVAATFFKAGFMLMVYMGILAFGIVIITVNNKAKAKKNALAIEFIEKVNEISSNISVGKTIPNAIDDVVNSGQISETLATQFSLAKQEILLGRYMSDAFMKMYKVLDIDEIRTFASTLSVYEETGGNILAVLKANDIFFQNKLRIKNVQKVYSDSLKMTQRMNIGIPVAFIVIVFIVNPSFFGTFYATIMGQLVGIFAISALVFGVWFSNKIAELK